MTLLARLALVAAITIATLGAAGQPAVDPTVVARFGGSAPEVTLAPSAELQVIIKREKARQLAYDGGGARPTEPYTGFRFDLDGDGHDEYFIHFSASATGNSVWGIFSDEPARFRGGVFAKYFFVHRRTGPWSSISTWVRNGWEEAVVAQSNFRAGEYRDGRTRIDRTECTDDGPGDRTCRRPFLERMGLTKCKTVFANGMERMPARPWLCYDD
jgi:hypothetical protein